MVNQQDYMKNDSAKRRHFYRQVGKLIWKARGKKLSQRELGAAIGLARTSITNIERGNQQILLHTLYDIAEALQIDVAVLLPSDDEERVLPPNIPDDISPSVRSKMAAMIQQKSQKRQP
jgi:transcriptional regulator with XRE-family HTH domain